MEKILNENIQHLEGFLNELEPNERLKACFFIIRRFIDYSQSAVDLLPDERDRTSPEMDIPPTSISPRPKVAARTSTQCPYCGGGVRLTPSP